ncbi:Conserved_hypothetical protein [Hexamita inflata]|uniref:C2H2-type domain-containing protein n=1 Tax=Hexamita inflata TaxID=28002 RepID=A0AA86N4W1_9EUKA|nr:Conserved hypothetical protein [Hexamita inflata]
MQNFEAQKPFIFVPPQAPFDWRLFASTDIDQAISQQNVGAIMHLVDTLAFGELDAPTGLQKVFKTQQFLLQYLIYVQQELQTQLLMQPVNDTEAIKQENENLKKELKQLRQKMQSDQMIARMASLKPELVEHVHRCLECGKGFADYKFLVQHYQSRHPGSKIPPIPLPNYKIEKPEYKLCNCKLELPKPPIVVEKLPTPKLAQTQTNQDSSDIYMERHEMTVKLNESPQLNAQSPYIFKNLQENALQPEKANFSMTSTGHLPHSTPGTQKIVQKEAPKQQEFIYEPFGNYNSFSSENDHQVIKSGFMHSKFELEQQMEMLRKAIGQ